MNGHQHNAGCGDQFCFHGAFKEKSAAVKKEEQTPGAFILRSPYPPYSIEDERYAVVTARKNPVPGSVRLSLRNIAIEWMQDNSWNFHNAQALAQAASTKYDVPVADLLPAARAVKLGPKANPFFTRSEKKKIAKSVRYTVKGAVRSLFGFGRKTKASGGRGRHTSASRSSNSALRDEVIAGLVQQGFGRRQAESMTPQAQSGDNFESLFKRALKRNPDDGEDAEGKNAIRVFKEFHGTEDAGKIFELENDLVKQKKFALLARLYGFDMKAFPRFYVDDPDMGSGRRQEPNLDLWRDNILLCSDAPKQMPNGKMGLAHGLFLWGGNQDLERLLPDFGVNSNTQLVLLGEIDRIWYVTKKAIHAHRDEKYVHPFGEKCRPTCPVDHEHKDSPCEKPILGYDRLIKHMFILGGDYTIHPEGIVN